MAKPKRSSQKIITRRAQVVRFMRVSRRISQSQAAAACGCSDQAIGHYETGRMDVSESRLGQMLAAYGYTREQFEEHISGKEISVDYRNECQAILGQLDEGKLKLIHGVLLTFAAKV